MNTNEWWQVGTALAVMAAAAAAMVWWSPEASVYVSRLMLARAMALREARRLYREIFDEHMYEGRPPAPVPVAKVRKRNQWISTAWVGAGLIVVVLVLRKIG
jgi:hypothetical protein